MSRSDFILINEQGKENFLKTSIKGDEIKSELWKMSIALILCGGQGGRFAQGYAEDHNLQVRTKLTTAPATKQSCLKQNVILPEGFSVLEQACIAFLQNKQIECLVVVCGTQTEVQNLQIIAQNYKKLIFFVENGRERLFSSLNGLSFIAKHFSQHFTKNNLDEVSVLIHDAARPFVSQNIINNCIAALQNGYLGAVPCTKVSDTIKKFENNTLSTPPRNLFYAAQTPQCFNFNFIYTCYQNYYQQYLQDPNNEQIATDDSSVAELFSPCSIKITQGESSNKKITTISDIFG